MKCFRRIGGIAIKSRRVNWLELGGRAYLVAIFLFTYLPVFIVIAYSFSGGERGGLWRGFTFDWYIRLLSNRSIQENLFNSLKIAIASCSIAVLIGTAGAVGMARSHFRGKELLENLTIAPLMLPEIILGMAYLSLFTAMQIRFGIGTMIIAHTTFCVPYIFLTVQSRLAGMDPNLVEAARDLGANAGRAFRDITLPLIAPGIFSGTLLAFAMSMDDVVISFFVKGVTTDTLPLRIFALSRVGVSAEIYALCSVMLYIMVFFILLYFLIDRLRSKNV